MGVRPGCSLRTSGADSGAFFLIVCCRKTRDEITALKIGDSLAAGGHDNPKLRQNATAATEIDEPEFPLYTNAKANNPVSKDEEDDSRNHHRCRRPYPRGRRRNPRIFGAAVQWAEIFLPTMARRWQ